MPAIWPTLWNATVVATYDETPVPADILVNWGDFGAAGFRATDYLLIRRADGTDAAAAAAALDKALRNDPLAVVSSVAVRRQSLADSLGRRLIQFDLLLGVSMLIAVLGIANALSLSVLERTRESAILRAAGLRRRQMYGKLLIEAVLAALVGGFVGAAFGLGLGWITARELILASRRWAARWPRSYPPGGPPERPLWRRSKPYERQSGSGERWNAASVRSEYADASPYSIGPSHSRGSG